MHAHEFTQWESCFDELGLDSKPVYDCYTSGLGMEVSFCRISFFDARLILLLKKKKLDVFIDIAVGQRLI